LRALPVLLADGGPSIINYDAPMPQP